MQPRLTQRSAATADISRRPDESRKRQTHTAREAAVFPQLKGSTVSSPPLIGSEVSLAIPSARARETCRSRSLVCLDVTGRDSTRYARERYRFRPPPGPEDVVGLDKFHPL